MWPLMNYERYKIWLPLAVLAGVLVVWAGFLALGAYLEIGADAPRRDPLKAVIVLATMGVFLGFWGMALWLRSKRKK